MIERDALELLQETAQAAKVPVLLSDASSAEEKVYAFDGKLHFLHPDPKPQDHKVDSLEDLIAYANSEVKAGQGGEFEVDEGTAEVAGVKAQVVGGKLTVEAAPPPVVWFDAAGVVLDLDPFGHRLDRVTLKFKRSAVFDSILSLANRDWMDQKDFVRLLKIELAGTLPPLTLLEPIRKLKFENGQTVNSTAGHGRESIGKSIQAEVNSEQGSIPEVVSLKFRMHVTTGEDDLYIIDAAVEIDPMRGKLRLTPLPDEIDRVTRQFVDTVRNRLGDGLHEDVAAYYGRP